MKNPCLTPSFYNHVRDLLEAAFYGRFVILLYSFTFYSSFLSFVHVSFYVIGMSAAGSTVKSSILSRCCVSDSLYNPWRDYAEAKPRLNVPHNVKLLPSGAVIPIIDTLEQKIFVVILRKYNMKMYEICFCLPSNQNISGGKGVWEEEMEDGINMILLWQSKSVAGLY